MRRWSSYVLCIAALAWFGAALALADPTAGDQAASDKASTDKPTNDKPSGNKAAKADKAKGDAAKGTAGKPLKPKRGDGFTPEREAAALTFVQQHHPELVEILNQLKQKHAKEYRHAVQDLFHTSERLAQSAERDMARYDRELVAWKLKSRIQLLAVRLRLKPDDAALRTELTEALQEQVVFDRQRLTEERQKLTTRLEKIDTQLKQLDEQGAKLVETRLTELLKPKPKAAAKQATKNVTKTDRAKQQAGQISTDQ